ncbi:aminotransferase class I/II-fold pyridoxal phosphate-dependent enzyme [Candidatus Micrarchaeota archaeon]|nr:aminotransferase class I/II-fold pyridoxal phosphate-dependent enzyme [Candidatus Micrarchaeota archaeon]
MKEFLPAERMKVVSYPIRDIVMEARKEEKAGKKMIYLNIGDPAQYGFEPPSIIKEEVKKALDMDLKGYAPSQGDDELIEKIAKIEGCSEENVFVTVGLTEGIEYFIQALVGKGEKLLLPNPTYPLYITKADVFEVKSEFYKHDADGQIDVEDLRTKIADAKAMVIINPNNPLGSLYSDNNLNEVIAICAEYNVPIFYDGSYDKLVFDGYSDFRKLAKGKVPFIYGSSLSKVYLYPGARVGWVAFHGDGWEKIKDAYFRLCNQRLSVNWEFQKAAAAAILDDSHLVQVKKDLLERRDAMIQAAEGLPLEYPMPKGAFYAFMKITSGKWSSDWDFARAAIKKGVVVVPGSGFGKQDGNYFRATFLPPAELIKEAFEKIAEIL